MRNVAIERLRPADENSLFDRLVTVEYVMIDHPATLCATAVALETAQAPKLEGQINPRGGPYQAFRWPKTPLNPGQGGAPQGGPAPPPSPILNHAHRRNIISTIERVATCDASGQGVGSVTDGHRFAWIRTGSQWPLVVTSICQCVSHVSTMPNISPVVRSTTSGELSTFMVPLLCLSSSIRTYVWLVAAAACGWGVFAIGALAEHFLGGQTVERYPFPAVAKQLQNPRHVLVSGGSSPFLVNSLTSHSSRSPPTRQPDQGRSAWRLPLSP